MEHFSVRFMHDKIRLLKNDNEDNLSKSNVIPTDYRIDKNFI